MLEWRALHVTEPDGWSMVPGSAGDAECSKMLWAVVQRLTREQLARGILSLLNELQAQVW